MTKEIGNEWMLPRKLDAAHQRRQGVQSQLLIARFAERCKKECYLRSILTQQFVTQDRNAMWSAHRMHQIFCEAGHDEVPALIQYYIRKSVSQTKLV